MTAAASAAADQDTADKASEDVEDTAADDQGDDTADDTKAEDSGEVDWEAKAKEAEAAVEAQKRINRNLERRGKRDLARIKELEGTKASTSSTSTKDAKESKGDDKPAGEVDVEKIRAEALEQAKKEAQREALKERVLDKIEAKANNFTDPADAVVMVMRGRTADDFIDDGKIDVDAIQDALTELLEKKPYLGAAQGGKNRFQGSADGGAKPQKPSRPKSLDEAVRRSMAT